MLTRLRKASNINSDMSDTDDNMAAGGGDPNDRMYQLILQIKNDLKELKDTAATKQDLVKLEEKIDDKLIATCKKSDEALSLAKAAADRAEKAEKKCDSLQEKINRLEAYNRRENLLILGIPETKDEQCKEIVMNFFTNDLKIDDARNIILQRVHRNPYGRKGEPRPIICRFAMFSDRQRVWDAKKHLKGTKKFLREDLPSDYVTRRNKLFPIMMKARELNRISYLKDDKLIVSNQQYTVDTLHNLPDELNPSTLATKQLDDKTIAFFTDASPLSNFHKANMTINGKTYSTVEKYFHYNMAMAAGQQGLAAKIDDCTLPAECKALGKKVEMPEKEYLTLARTIMQTGCLEKFRQNDQLKKTLIDTGDCTLLEASKDKVWGCGLSLYDKDLVVAEKRNGSNLMGKILESVRKELIEQS